MTRPKQSVRMACGHWRHFTGAIPPPAPGDYLFCLQCMRETHMPYPLPLDVDGKPVLKDWRWLCRSKHCPMSVTTGASRYEAVRRASKHIRYHPQHDVHVIRPDGVIELRLGRDPNQLALFDPQPQESLPF